MRATSPTSRPTSTRLAAASLKPSWASAGSRRRSGRCGAAARPAGPAWRGLRSRPDAAAFPPTVGRDQMLAHFAAQAVHQRALQLTLQVGADVAAELLDVAPLHAEALDEGFVDRRHDRLGHFGNLDGDLHGLAGQHRHAPVSRNSTSRVFSSPWARPTRPFSMVSNIMPWPSTIEPFSVPSAGRRSSPACDQVSTATRSPSCAPRLTGPRCDAGSAGSRSSGRCRRR